MCSARLGCQTFAVAEPSTSTFRVLGLSAPAIKALVNLEPTASALDNLLSEAKVGQAGNHSGDSDSSQILKTTTAREREKPLKIPRPPNAFILYRQDFHPIIKAENPDFHNNDICRSSFSFKPLLPLIRT